ncbi:MAG: hypothetical protein KUG73_09450 [Pseudomonadales bacterium]|nr:hypothetical protein [Pseudomonadales bacterium]
MSHKKIVHVVVSLLIGISCVSSMSSVAAKRPGNVAISQIEFNDATVGDAIKVLVDLTGVNIIATRDAAKENVSFFVRDTTVRGVVDSLCRVAGLWYRYDNDTKVYIVMTEEQYKKDVVVYRQESTKIFVLKHQNVASTAFAIEALYGDRVTLTKPENDDSYQLDGDFGGGGSGGGNKNEEDDENDENNDNKSAASNLLTSDKLTLSQLSFLDKIDGIRRVDENLVNQISQRAEPPINITFNYLHNLILIRTSDDKAIEDIAKMISELDKPTRQVLLEMKVLELTLGDDDRSIFDFTHTSDSTATGPNSDNNGNPLGGNGELGVPATTIGLGNYALDGGTAVFQWMNDNVLARVQLMQSEDRIDVVSNPMLLAANNKDATLFIGEDRLMTTGVRSFGGNTTSDGVREPLYVEARTEIQAVGNALTIWPRINDDRSVTLDIQHINSSINTDSAKIPVSGSGGVVSEFPIDTIQRTSMQLTAVAQEGRTIAVGGIIRKESGESIEKVPFFGDLPGIGFLFRKTVLREQRKELLLLITPHIFETSDEAQKASRALYSELSKVPDVADIWQDKKITRKQPVPTAAEASDATGIISALRYAALATHGQLSTKPDGWHSRAADFSQWKLHTDVEATAIASWQYNDRIVTAAVLTNKDKTLKKIKTSWFGSGWNAVSLEEDAIPANKTTLVYLVSDESAANILTRQGQEFMYTADGLLGNSFD